MQAQQALCHQEHPSSCSSRMEVFSPKKLMTLMLSCITEMMLETTGNMKLIWGSPKLAVAFMGPFDMTKRVRFLKALDSEDVKTHRVLQLL